MTDSRRVRWAPLGAVAVALLCTLSFPAHAGKRGHLEPTWRYSGARPITRSLDHTDPDAFGLPLRSAAAVDTTVLSYWDFSGCNTEGWTSADRTAQVGTFFHVDDFAGLGGGDFGRLNPIEGNQSLWCGLRPGQTDPNLCSYAALPGYGNLWDQLFRTVDCLDVTGDATVDYRIAWDSEPGYDYTTLQYDRCDDDWVDIEGGLGVWDDVGSGTYSSVVSDSLHAGSIRLRFRFQSDPIWSDEDALWDTDGAVIIDSLTVSDALGTLLPTEDFESEAVGAMATVSGNWVADVVPGYGDYAALVRGYNAVQEDPCVSNASCMWGFFAGSTADYGCGGHPAQQAIPYGNERGQYIWNEVWSPWVAFTGTGNTVELAFDVYNDLPLDPVVFYVWHVRSRVGGPCPGVWQDRNWVYYADDVQKRWRHHVESIADLIAPGATEVQVALGVWDNCWRWCGSYGTGNCHSHAPLFDNVEIRRIQTEGPQWSVRDIDLFQDTFASDGTTTGTARIDAAVNTNTNLIYPGDSTVVTVFDPEVGLATDPHTGTGPAVYGYFSVWNGIDPYSGPEIVGDDTRWPLVDSLSHGGRTWYCVRMDTTYDEDGVPVPNQFCVDLNDNLFVPGDTVYFFFAATSAAPGGQTSYWSPFTGPTFSVAEVLEQPDECTILPAAGWKRGGYIFYVDGYNGKGAQPFFDTAFKAIGLFDEVDRYDIRGPGERAGNHPGARVTNVQQQLLGTGSSGYRVIIWNTGDVAVGTIGDGIYPELSDDAGMLLECLDGVELGGLFLSGDNIAEEWEHLDGSAPTLRNTYIPFTLQNGNHNNLISRQPMVIGEPGSPFVHFAGPDTAYALSRCPDRHEFDVLSPVAPWSQQTLRYDHAFPDGAGVGQWTHIGGETPRDVRVDLWGFSYHQLRDDRVSLPMDRFDMMFDVLTQYHPLSWPLAAGEDHRANRLAQNVPNPFNPITTIEFTIKDRAPVTLRVYNVRGQLVRTLVDGVRAPGIVHRIEWDGRNDAGQRVASGVYFYRLSSREFTRTRKMVLLK